MHSKVRLRVLVVEDEVFLAEALQSGLRHEAIAADIALNGDDALAQIAATDYAAVVLDRDIPGVHGDEVCAIVSRQYPIGITEALLRLSDANAIAATFEPVDLAAIVQAAILENAPDAEHSGVLLETNLEAAATFGDRALLEQLASNLVQNAIRHNLSPGWARVTTGISSQDSSVALTIENDGRHHSKEAAARLTEPFLRGDARTSEPGRNRGYGLGLALVSRITTLHDGLLTIVPRPEGGLITTVTLPISASRR